MEDFIPMGSKEHAERIKRKGLNLEQESAKKQKTSKEVPKEAMSPKEVPEEKSQFMRELREDTFSGNKNEDAYDHVDRVLNIVHRLTLGAVNTWDLLKKAFIQRYCPPSKTAKRLEEIHNFKQESDESLYQAWERYNDFLYKCPTHDINNHQKVSNFYKGLNAINHQFLDSQGPIPGMTPTQALMEIQTMADHSQKWHDGTSSRNVSNNSNTDGLAANDLNLTKNVLSTRKLKSCKRQCKVVNDEDETLHSPISSRKLNNKEGWTTKDIQCQLPPKEVNPGNFTLPCTIRNFNFYYMADLGASVNVMPRNTFEYLRLANLGNTNMLVEMADMTKKAPLGIDNTREKGHMLDKIWEYCKDVHRDSRYWWHDHGFEDEEHDEMGIETESSSS
nr:hypothetical protein [Tanacetum cinerariifolium]GEX46780.1 hypothetical protein [Tanacetum cinerariifolium]